MRQHDCDDADGRDAQAEGAEETAAPLEPNPFDQKMTRQAAGEVRARGNKERKRRQEQILLAESAGFDQLGMEPVLEEVEGIYNAKGGDVQRPEIR